MTRPAASCTTDHRRSRPFRFNGRAPDRFESIFDSYVNLKSSRRACLHPRIVRFLELLFAARPIATQQLLFLRSNGHEARQDTAFVCMEEPLLMVASWIALEDVVAGRGELTDYEGSHRPPGRRFDDGSRRFTPGADDSSAMRDDLVHGSNPRTRPLEETRHSCVTHYCPETTRPLWMSVHPDRGALRPRGPHAFLSSSHYRLPEAGTLPS